MSGRFNPSTTTDWQSQDWNSQDWNSYNFGWSYDYNVSSPPPTPSPPPKLPPPSWPADWTCFEVRPGENLQDPLSDDRCSVR